MLTRENIDEFALFAATRAFSSLTLLAQIGSTPVGAIDAMEREHGSRTRNLQLGNLSVFVNKEQMRLWRLS